MKSKIILALVAIEATLAWQARAQIYDTNNVVVQTFAGSGFSGHVDGQGTQTMFYNPRAIVSDSSSNLFVWDYNNGCIRKITPDGTVTTFAGGGLHGLPAYGTNASLDAGYGNGGICLSQGIIFVADQGNQRIRNVTFDPSTQPGLPAYLQFSTSTGLQIVGTVGRAYRVESSPDMTNWTTRTTLLLTSSPYLWIDQSPVSGNKFYRAWLLP